MRQELQRALTQATSVCQDQLQQTLKRHVCQEECVDAESHQEMDQLRQLIAQQAEAMKRFESHSQQLVTQQQEEWAQKQHAQFQQFDGALRDKDEVMQEETQEAMTAQPHRLLIKTSMINSIVDHQRIQTLVAMMVEEDVGLDTRLP